jgi:DNA transformation protein
MPIDIRPTSRRHARGRAAGFYDGPMSNFSDSLHEVFAPFGRITPRRMFGGHGIFHEGRMFALELGERLYLKSDAQSEAAFEAKRLAPFEYQRDGRTMRMSYREAPPEMFEDRDEALHWARLAWDAALRSGTAPRAAGAKAAKTSKTSKASNSVKAEKAEKAAKPVKPVKTAKTAKAAKPLKARATTKLPAKPKAATTTPATKA